MVKIVLKILIRIKNEKAKIQELLRAGTEKDLNAERNGGADEALEAGARPLTYTRQFFRANEDGKCTHM